MNKQVEQYLNYFLGLPVSPNYAVMVTGQWGAGKTQLVRKVCEAFDGADLKVYYISLYGLSSTKQIDDLVFACLHPVLVIPPKRAASKSRINTSPAFSAGRVSLLKPSYAFALE